jgi:CheY-like chemotaxis protein
MSVAAISWGDMSNSLNQWSKANNSGPANRRISDSPVVMVVEDEFLIRIMITDELRNAGYEVVECGSADEAIDLLRGGASIGIVFTDIRLPGSMDGVSLAQAVRSEFPAMKVVATSAQKRPETLTGQFVPKPYNPRSVVHLIDALTAAPARLDSCVEMAGTDGDVTLRTG